MVKDGALNLDFEDEVTKATVSSPTTARSSARPSPSLLRTAAGGAA